jgi:cyclophilin family peptidyl-prolyl cis-trans isomerase
MTIGRTALTMTVACAGLVFTLFSSDLPAQQKEPNPVVVVETTVGNITIELFKDRSPVTVENFLSYANSGFYGGTIFHRVIRNVVIQGGGFTPQMRLKPTRPPIKNEAQPGVQNLRGTVAAARTSDVDSATSQFFINVEDNPSLDHKSRRQVDFGYAVFGRVIEGMDVVDQISGVKVNKELPQSLIMIMRVSLKDPQ